MVLYDRYVDDTKQGAEKIKKGTRFEDGALTWSKQREEEDKDTPDDILTFTVLQQIANTISPTLRVTFETPSQYPNGKLPLLDTQIWVENNLVRHEYYEKPMTSKYVIMASSAHPDRMKRAVLVEEGMRRMRNCSPDAPWKTITPHLEKFAWKMMVSGYPQSYRGTIIRLAVEKFRKSRETPDKQQTNHPQEPGAETGLENRAQQQMPPPRTGIRERGCVTISEKAQVMTRGMEKMKILQHSKSQQPQEEN